MFTPSTPLPHDPNDKHLDVQHPQATYIEGSTKKRKSTGAERKRKTRENPEAYAREIARKNQKVKDKRAVARAQRKAEKAEQKRLEKIAKAKAKEERARAVREKREAKELAAKLRREKREAKLAQK